MQDRISTPWSFLGVFLFSLIISSCKDEAGFVGLQKAPRLNTLSIDIPLSPSVIQNSGVLTDNPTSEVITRILVGRYNDPLFGNTEARGFVNFAPPPTYVKPTVNATFDSLILQLRFDYYYRGQTTTSLQHIDVYELLDTIHYLKPYYASTNLATSSVPLAGKDFYVSGDAFDNAIALNTDSDTTNNVIFTVKIKIPGNMGQSLLNDFKANPVTIDSLFEKFQRFSGKYKGFSFVVPNGQGDKILGINPLYRTGNPKVTDTKLSLYYTDVGVSTKADFVLYANVNGTTGRFSSAISYSKITTDRSATALAGIVPFQDFKPSDGHYYLQGGTSLLTKLDLKNFYNFIDTIDHISFNQAELIVTNISPERPPRVLSLRVFDSLNRIRNSILDTLINRKSSNIIDLYFQKTASAFNAPNTVTNTTVTVIPDTGTDIPVATDTYIISNIYLTNMCQQLYKYRTDKRRPKALALGPAGDEFRKSVSGLILNGNISLRLYYSKPVVKIR